MDDWGKDVEVVDEQGDEEADDEYESIMDGGGVGGGVGEAIKIGCKDCCWSIMWDELWQWILAWPTVVGADGNANVLNDSVTVFVAVVVVVADELIMFNEASSFNGFTMTGFENGNEDVVDVDVDNDDDDDDDNDDDDDVGADETITSIRSILFINSPF